MFKMYGENTRSVPCSLSSVWKIAMGVEQARIKTKRGEKEWVVNIG